jgi:imidazolonepropionase-like amidohydrolase
VRSFFTLILITAWLPVHADQPLQITSAPYTPDSGDLLIRCGQLIDGKSDQVLNDAYVLIEAGRISSVSTDNALAVDRVPLNLPDHTCMPGFIDMHTHILESYVDWADLSVYFGYSLQTLLDQGEQYAEETLMSGFTTVRNPGAYYGWSGRELRNRINLGLVKGPRMQIAGFYLTIPGGGGDLLIPNVDENDIPSHLRLGVAKGVDEFRRKAKDAVDGGADFLKLIASGAVLAYDGVPAAAEMTAEEIAAVVEVGHAAGLRVAAHAHGAQSIKDSIRAGADSIEHASLIDDEGIALAREMNVVLVMDVFNGDWVATQGRIENWPEEFLRKNDETTLIQRQNFTKAHAAGVVIVFGSDAGVYPHGMNARQFAYMVEWGMTPMEAIKSATSLAARHLGWEEQTGAIQPGLLGDLIAVRGDPLEDVAILQNVEVVVKGGLVFKLPVEITPSPTSAEGLKK